MATEEQKKENLVRMYKLVITGLGKGIWDMVGESAFAIMRSVGDGLLEIMQKEMGLEVGGASLHDTILEIDRLFVDEFGFADKIELVEDDGSHAVVHVIGCNGFNLSKNLSAAGVEKPFICPIMNVMNAAIRKNTGNNPSVDIAPDEAQRGSTITFKY